MTGKGRKQRGGGQNNTSHVPRGGRSHGPICEGTLTKMKKREATHDWKDQKRTGQISGGKAKGRRTG